MSCSEYDNLVEAIALYKLVVNDALSDLRRPFYLDLTIIVIIPIALVIMALMWSNIIGFLAALGIGGINAGDRIRRGQTVLKTYWSDRSKLKRSVRRLEFELLLCAPITKKDNLPNVEKLLRDYFDALD